MSPAGFYCYMCTDIVTSASWGFTLKVKIQLYFNFPVQIGPKIYFLDCLILVLI